ncbi:elongation factor G [Occultella glacieicola]|uniref:Elongation factor G n=1 Tax=Occultella glacieicola TaxID=2518684 RepID=A0ABY2E5H9_9MICO|nr:elongation factor G [Occultella glacieicola]TDE94765.1 elongation factor G [Occultella glacieicola]
MDDPRTQDIRTIAVIGHGGCGKTTLVEALLQRAGVIGRMGRTEDGSTVCDTDPEATRRGISTTLALAPLDWTTAGRGYRVNVIDTPGHDDFGHAVDVALSVADLAVLVVAATSGVEPGTQRAWARCVALGLPRLVFVTKEDKAGADFHRVLSDLQDRFGPTIRAVELPLGERDGFQGIADLLTDTDTDYDGDGRSHPVAAPPEIAAQQHRLHEDLVEEVVTGDDDQLERYLAGDQLTPAEIRATLAAEVAAETVVPVLVGSAVTGVGITELLDQVCLLGPPPRPTRVLVGGRETEVPADPDGEPLVHVFRTVTDPFVGQVSVIKVLSGTVQAEDHLTNTGTGASERLHGLFRIRGTEHLLAVRVPAGDIAAVAKLTDSPTRTLLARPGRPVTLGEPSWPEPGYSVAVHAATPAEEDRLPEALRRLCAEDPALATEHVADTGQILLSGTGDTHLDVSLERLERKFGVRAVSEPVRVAFRETLATAVEVEGRVKKQSGGHGQFAVVRMRLRPAPRGTGLTFESKVVGGAVPRQYLPAVQRGLAEAMAAGGAHGHPVVDVVAECVDGKYHSVDSSEMAFRAAAAHALREAVAEAGTVILEPIDSVQVTVPDSSTGDVLADLGARRAQVLGTRTLDGGTQVIEALVPAAELGRYVIDLRSLTGGWGSVRTSHDHYDVQPTRLTGRAAGR